MTRGTFILASCSKSKRDGVHQARNLYEPSPIFRKRRRFARKYGDAWGVLSARYGFLRPWDVTPTYNTHIRDRTPAWAVHVLGDLCPALSSHDTDRVVILAGSKYVAPLVAPLERRGYTVVDYNAGLRPGERMQALDAAVEGDGGIDL